MQNYKNTANAYWEFVGLFKDVFVRFYISEDGETLYQQCITGDWYYFEKENLFWKSPIDDIGAELVKKYREKDETPTYINPFLDTSELIPMDRRKVEQIEDMWVLEKQEIC